MKGESYDAFVEVLAKNIDTLNKEDLLTIMQGLVTDLKRIDREMFGVMYETKSEDLMDTYSHVTRQHVETLGATIRDLAYKTPTVTTENALPGDIIK